MMVMRSVDSTAQIGDVVRLAREIWQEHYAGLIGQEQVDYMLAKFQSDAAIAAQIGAGYAYYLMIYDGEPVGYFAVVPEPVASRMLLSKIYISAGVRGKGIGRQALEFVEGLCRQQGLQTLWLTVNKHNPTLAWYRRRGFSCADSIIQDSGGGFVMDDYRMEKRVAQ